VEFLPKGERLGNLTWRDELHDLIRRRWYVGQEFTIQDLYAFEAYLAEKYPNNKHIRETLRDKIQDLRNEGFIEFMNYKGTYRRIARHGSGAGDAPLKPL
jgi:hypothetical protein